jgi:hypothetical protein
LDLNVMAVRLSSMALRPSMPKRLLRRPRLDSPRLT